VSSFFVQCLTRVIFLIYCVCNSNIGLHCAQNSLLRPLVVTNINSSSHRQENYATHIFDWVQYFFLSRKTADIDNILINYLNINLILPMIDKRAIALLHRNKTLTCLNINFILPMIHNFRTSIIKHKQNK
jgi:hypothetical protein